jgi:hypothetical protein
MLFSRPAEKGSSGGVFYKKPAGVGRTGMCTGSNQRGLVSPGLPASPQPGLKGAGLVDGVFFGEKHV